MSFRFIDISRPLNLGHSSTNDNINVIYQFFIPDNKERYKEIKECLIQNINNRYVDKVILLNERMYTHQELGIKNSDKLEQIDIGKRLTFAETFRQISERNIVGYNVIMNSDIFVDETINKLRFSDIHTNKAMLAQLRYNYVSGTSLNQHSIWASLIVKMLGLYILILILLRKNTNCLNSILGLLDATTNSFIYLKYLDMK